MTLQKFEIAKVSTVNSNMIRIPSENILIK
jgi:hypothetical protein